RVDVVVIPPFPFLAQLAKKFEDSPIGVGAQNCHEAASGAYTGEVSVEALKSVGCRYVVLGHSERRHVFKESDARIADKVHAVLAAGLTPIFCIGETLDEREAGQTIARVRQQLVDGLAKVPRAEVTQIVLAYEPVWAIGTGRTASPAQAQEVHAALRGILSERYGADVAQAMRIQYGGSVKPDNAAALMAQEDVDGALVGGASLDADSFASIVRYYREQG
ncbi:MAG: triose-phosphate isomerase, partial [Bdellovibrionales bacterium]|nr:triose-phosphate isomerase [Bdellovibrionales bacterium]